jgi:hypothetical protein
LRDLTQHLTTRADDSHATPVQVPDLTGRLPFRFLLQACQALVRFHAYRRIKPHAPPLVRVPVNSFEFQRCRRTPQVGHLMCLLRHRPKRPTPSVHRLLQGLPGYLILFAPLAFVFQCQYRTREPLSPLVFLPISTDFIPFTPNKSEQRLPPPYYRGCWHGVSRGFLCSYCHLRPMLENGYSSELTELYTPKGFIAHAASHCQGFPHCKRFSTAASRRSLGSVSVPVWLTILSDQLPVFALVSHYLTNKLIGRGLLFR